MTTFLINPVAKPRMTQRDRWSKRPVVQKYWAYKDAIKWLAKSKKFELGNVIEIVFHMPMPESWSFKHKADMDGKPHQQKPDLDNLLKAVQDCLLPEDSSVWKVVAEKRWAKEGSIEIL